MTFDLDTVLGHGRTSLNSHGYPFIVCEKVVTNINI